MNTPTVVVTIAITALLVAATIAQCLPVPPATPPPIPPPPCGYDSDCAVADDTGCSTCVDGDCRGPVACQPAPCFPAGCMTDDDCKVCDGAACAVWGGFVPVCVGGRCVMGPCAG